MHVFRRGQRCNQLWGEDPDGHIRKDAERSGLLIRLQLIRDLHVVAVSEKDGLVPSGWMKRQ